ncbi:MAG: type I restriction endonuclease [Victivallaceae bacterium]|nr:type I restriction endonuclease [Victivallaceae bacterium]
MHKKLSQLALRIASGLESIPNEATTISSLVRPFVSALGYDVNNPDEFVSEYRSDFTNRGDCADCAILRSGEPIMLLECKDWRLVLNDDHVRQLRKYFSVHPSVKVGILTNGVDYRFYTDSENPNIMDCFPFLSFSLSEIDSMPFKALNLFTQSNYHPRVLSRVRTAFRMKNDILRELSQPSGELSRIILSSVDLSPDASLDCPESARFQDQVLAMVRSGLAGVVDPDLVSIHSVTGNWCSISVRNRNVIEVQFNEKTGKKWILMNVLDGIKHPIANLSDVEKYRDQLRDAAKLILRK